MWIILEIIIDSISSIGSSSSSHQPRLGESDFDRRARKTWEYILFALVIIAIITGTVLYFLGIFE